MHRVSPYAQELLADCLEAVQKNNLDEIKRLRREADNEYQFQEITALERDDMIDLLSKCPQS